MSNFGGGFGRDEFGSVYPFGDGLMGEPSETPHDLETNIFADNGPPLNSAVEGAFEDTGMPSFSSESSSSFSASLADSFAINDGALATLTPLATEHNIHSSADQPNAPDVAPVRQSGPIEASEAAKQAFGDDDDEEEDEEHNAPPTPTNVTAAPQSIVASIATVESEHNAAESLSQAVGESENGESDNLEPSTDGIAADVVAADKVAAETNAREVYPIGNTTLDAGMDSAMNIVADPTVSVVDTANPTLLGAADSPCASAMDAGAGVPSEESVDVDMQSVDETPAMISEAVDTTVDAEHTLSNAATTKSNINTASVSLQPELGHTQSILSEDMDVDENADTSQHAPTEDEELTQTSAAAETTDKQAVEMIKTDTGASSADDSYPTVAPSAVTSSTSTTKPAVICSTYTESERNTAKSLSQAIVESEHNAAESLSQAVGESENGESNNLEPSTDGIAADVVAADKVAAETNAREVYPIGNTTLDAGMDSAMNIVADPTVSVVDTANPTLLGAADSPCASAMDAGAGVPSEESVDVDMQSVDETPAMISEAVDTTVDAEHTLSNAATTKSKINTASVSLQPELGHTQSILSEDMDVDENADTSQHAPTEDEELTQTSAAAETADKQAVEMIKTDTGASSADDSYPTVAPSAVTSSTSTTEPAVTGTMPTDATHTVQEPSEGKISDKEPSEGNISDKEPSEGNISDKEPSEATEASTTPAVLAAKPLGDDVVLEGSGQIDKTVSGAVPPAPIQLASQAVSQHTSPNSTLTSPTALLGAGSVSSTMPAPKTPSVTQTTVPITTASVSTANPAPTASAAVATAGTSRMGGYTGGLQHDGQYEPRKQQQQQHQHQQQQHQHQQQQQQQQQQHQHQQHQHMIQQQQHMMQQHMQGENTSVSTTMMEYQHQQHLQQMQQAQMHGFNPQTMMGTPAQGKGYPPMYGYGGGMPMNMSMPYQYAMSGGVAVTQGGGTIPPVMMMQQQRGGVPMMMQQPGGHEQQMQHVAMSASDAQHSGFAPGGGVPSKAASARRKPPRKSRAGGSTKNTTLVGGDIAGSKSDAATPLFSRFKAPVQSITYGVDRLYSSAISGGPVVGGHEATPSKGTALSVSPMTLTAYGKDMQERVWNKAKLPVNHFMRPTDVKYKAPRKRKPDFDSVANNRSMRLRVEHKDCSRQARILRQFETVTQMETKRLAFTGDLIDHLNALADTESSTLDECRGLLKKTHSMMQKNLVKHKRNQQDFQSTHKSHKPVVQTMVAYQLSTMVGSSGLNSVTSVGLKKAAPPSTLHRSGSVKATTAGTQP